MSFIRAQQRTLTALFPHQANKKYLVPKRTLGPKVSLIAFKTASTTIEFDRDTTGGDEVGWAVEIDGVSEAVTSVIQGVGDTEIVVSYALQSVAAAIRVTYGGGGGWIDNNGAALKRLDLSGVIV